ncbi:MAG TPA: hypothetical protein VH419_08445 [Nocardioidaceae bacterium]|jgi:hypothetical protein
MIESAAVFSLLAGACGAASTFPYLRDTLRRSTVPHRGSWLIWGVIEVVAVEAQRADGARWSLVPLAIQAAGTCIVFALSVRFGSGGVSRMDLALIALAGAGVVGWLAVDEPLIATTCVIAADFLAALMMLPKTWREPGSETMATYAFASLGGAATVGAVGTLSVSLLIYPVYFTLLNAGLALVIGHRSRLLRHPRRALAETSEPLSNATDDMQGRQPALALQAGAVADASE